MKNENYINRSAAVLGSTGSVGTQAIDALQRLGVKIELLTAGRNIDLVARQAVECGVRAVAVPDAADGEKLRAMLPDTVKVYSGESAVCDSIRECGCDLIVHSISGMAGIPAALAAADTGARIAMANKEALISLGHLIYERLEKSGGELIPVDSEHSAIFQCLCAAGAASPKAPADSSRVRRILLTASGGPFFGQKREELLAVTPEMALAHPTWKMGAKITIDCATLMNKGFELIEACRLFNVEPDRVEVLVHRQSIIHSMVEYTDGAVIAELSYPDMRDCVRYALAYPDRAPFGGEPLDFVKVGSLTFHAPDTEAFPLLSAAVDAWYKGGTAPAALIAADEEAVAAFIQKKLSFNGISDIVRETIEKCNVIPADSPEAVFAAEREAREIARRLIQR
ncbi:MAG: 1-deoxy-D-xylulose-5-phosphate reductoisomerase [Ruminococcaceae bacterium]|nr:1-deoxy-D-xylulose-5-phosphate reductoisomerase [Oscillospiraceae bacterium]